MDGIGNNGFGAMKSALSGNVSMDKVAPVTKTIMRSYRVDTDIVEALGNTDINKNKFVNNTIRAELVKRGLL